MTITYPCDRAVIEQVLPHRDPFVWLTRVVACEEGSHITAELDVDPDLPLFAGHFPTHPVLPGVILMEALAQAASFCLLTARESAAGSIGFLVGIDNAKFRSQVRPGDTVTLEATIVKSSRRLCVAEVRASVGDVTCATATQKYVLAASEEKPASADGQAGDAAAAGMTAAARTCKPSASRGAAPASNASETSPMRQELAR